MDKETKIKLHDFFVAELTRKQTQKGVKRTELLELGNKICILGRDLGK